MENIYTEHRAPSSICKITCVSLLTALLVAAVGYCFQAAQFFITKNQPSETRDYLLEMARVRIAELPVSTENKIQLGHPGGIPLYACNFWTFEYWRRDCFGIQVFSKSGDFLGIDQILGIFSKPCAYIGLLERSRQTKALKHFNCGSGYRSGKLAVAGFEVVEHVFSYGGKRNESNRKFVFIFEYGG